MTGLNLLRGGLRHRAVPAYAEFATCGQGLREMGDVKLRGILVGRIGDIEREHGKCTVELDLQPGSVEEIPKNVGAQIRAKTLFGEKWVELLYPDDPVDDRLSADARIGQGRTIDPLEVETILNLSLPVLEAIDPQNLAAALSALEEGFVGHERAAIRGIESGLEAMAPVTENPRLVGEGIRQLRETGELFDRIDHDLFAALDNLDRLNRWTVGNEALIAENLTKTPVLLRELSDLFETRFQDLTKLVDRGATVVGVLAARSDDIDRLLSVLPAFNSNWIRNLNHVCEHRQITDESTGTRVPGRCWRVHNLLSHSRGGYGTGGPEDDDGARRRDSSSQGQRSSRQMQASGPHDVAELLLGGFADVDLTDGDDLP